MVNRDAIVSIVDQITIKKGAPCKKTLQKIVFLIEAKGINLGCDYGIHFYGPYSTDLDYTIRELNDDGILNIEYTQMEHNISVKDKTSCKKFENDTVTAIINEFGAETASELELLATALYVYIISSKDASKIENGVRKIKGEKYSDSRIQGAISRLRKTGYVIN